MEKLFYNTTNVTNLSMCGYREFGERYNIEKIHSKGDSVDGIINLFRSIFCPQNVKHYTEDIYSVDLGFTRYTIGTYTEVCNFICENNFYKRYKEGFDYTIDLDGRYFLNPYVIVNYGHDNSHRITFKSLCEAERFIDSFENLLIVETEDSSEYKIQPRL